MDGSESGAPVDPEVDGRELADPKLEGRALADPEVDGREFANPDVERTGTKVELEVRGTESEVEGMRIETVVSVENGGSVDAANEEEDSDVELTTGDGAVLDAAPVAEDCMVGADNIDVAVALAAVSVGGDIEVVPVGPDATVMSDQKAVLGGIEEGDNVGDAVWLADDGDAVGLLPGTVLLNELTGGENEMIVLGEVTLTPVETTDVFGDTAKVEVAEEVDGLGTGSDAFT
jgi:hypothetical protein